MGVVTAGCVPEPASRGRIGGLSPADASNPVIAALLTRTIRGQAPNIPGVHSTVDGCPDGPNATLTTPSYNRLTSFIAQDRSEFQSPTTADVAATSSATASSRFRWRDGWRAASCRDSIRSLRRAFSWFRSPTCNVRLEQGQ